MSTLQDGLLQIVRDGHDLNLRQVVVLLEVAEGRAHPTVRHLAAHLQVSKPAITRAIDRLQGMGWARRETEQQDKRSILVVLTDEGRQAACRMAEAGGLFARAA